MLQKDNLILENKLHYQYKFTFCSRLFINIVNTDFGSSPLSPCIAFTHFGNTQEADFLYVTYLI